MIYLKDELLFCNSSFLLSKLLNIIKKINTCLKISV